MVGKGRKHSFSSKSKFFNEKDNLRINIFLPIIDSLSSNLKQRKIAYDKINNDFNFFTNLFDMNDDSIAEHCENLSEKYDTDLCAESLKSECN